MAEVSLDFRAAILLAAGHGTRMGGPKARLLMAGDCLLVHHVRRMLEIGVERVVAVVPPSLEIEADDSVMVAVSEAPDPAGSLAVGMRALCNMSPDDAVLVTPIDTLPPSDATYEALARALAGGARAATPVFGGRGGHPVACRFEELAAYEAAKGPYPPLREMLSALGSRRTRVSVNDATVPIDLDTPADVQRVTGSAPAFAARIEWSRARFAPPRS